MTKKRLVNLFKSSLIVLLFGALVVASTACSCNEMESDKVYNNFVEFVNSNENIFEFKEVEISEGKKSNILNINIPYDEKINTMLECEVNGLKNTSDATKNDIYGYNQYMNDEATNFTDDTHVRSFSDFYIIKAVYEPMLDVATYQIGKNYETLNTNKDKLDNAKANEVNEKLNAVKSSSGAFMASLKMLNNHASHFSETSELYIYDYRTPNKNIYLELKNFKKSFENLIMDCFNLNQSFMELYLSIRPTYDFSTASVEDFADNTKNQTMKVVLNDYLNYMLTMSSYVAFSIDGGQCSFINSNDSFSALYSKVDNGNFANRYIYQEHFAQIRDVFLNKDLFDFYDGDAENLEASYLPYVIDCQKRFNAFMQQFANFKEALNGVDYKAYIMSDIYSNSKKDYLNYASTLKDDESTKFIIVQQFLDDYYVPLAQSLQALQHQMLA